MSGNDHTTFFTRYARFLWLAALFVPPGSAYLAYLLTPHEEIWHDVLYSLLCIPIFLVWLVILFGCLISFLSYWSTADS